MRGVPDFLALGKIWFRNGCLLRDYRIWNFTGHKANASFPSNHTMNGGGDGASSMHMKGSRLMTLMAMILAFPGSCRGSLSQRSSGRHGRGLPGTSRPAVHSPFSFYPLSHRDFFDQ